MSYSRTRKATRRLVASFAAALAVLQTGAAADANSPVAPSPAADSIVRQALARVATYPVPPYAIYTTFWDIRTNQPDRTGSQQEWRYAVRQSDNAENATCRVGQTWLPQATIESDMLPLLAKTFFEAPLVAISTENYRLQLVSDTQGLASQPYHVRFMPISDGAANNVRELWVDRSTFDVRGIRYVAKNGTTVTARFGSTSNYQTATHLEWISSGNDGNRSYDVTILRAAFPQMLAGWLFDQSAYDRKQRSGTSDVLNQTLAEIGEDITDAPRTPHANAAYTRFTDRTTVVSFPVCDLAS